MKALAEQREKEYMEGKKVEAIPDAGRTESQQAEVDKLVGDYNAEY